LNACRSLLLHEARIQPLVIVFEDLHWIDPETQAFLELLVDSIADAPILVLFNYRPEYNDPWLDRPYFTHLRLAPLKQLGGEELLASLLGADPALQPLQAEILARTEGNPFFIEESVQGLVEDGALSGEAGAYRLAIPVRSISVPASVQTVLAARIDRLEPETKRLLQTAAVIGKDFGYALLDRVGEVETAVLNDQLTILQAGEFVYGTRLFPEPEYTFKHALTHQVTYEGMLYDRRRELHRKIFDAMEAETKDHPSEGLERLAYHAMRGENWQRAYEYARDAGRNAVALNANRSALEFFETAADALSRLPENDEHLDAAISLRFDIRDVLFIMGDADAILPHMNAAETFALQLKDHRRLIEVLLYKSGHFWSIGENIGQGIPLAKRAYDLARDLDDPELTALACYRLTTSHALVGDYREAAAYAEEGLALLDSQAETLFRFGGLVHTFIGSFYALASAELGDFESADRVGRRSYEMAVAADHAYSITVTCFGIAHSYLLQDRIEEALQILDNGLRQVEIHKAMAAALWVAGRAIYALARSGRGDEIAALMDMLRDSGDLPPSMRHGFAFIWAARGLLELGRIDEAEELVRIALDEPAGDPDRGVAAWGRWILANVAARRDQHDKAQEHLAAAGEIADDLGMTPLQALCERFGH
jgi:tetratricopeptide (TPR) repeat protein